MAYRVFINNVERMDWCCRGVTLTSPPSGSGATLTSEVGVSSGALSTGDTVKIQSLGGVDIYQGKVRWIETSSEGGMIVRTARVMGDWYDMERTIFTQTYWSTAWSGTAYVPTPFQCSDIFLGLRSKVSEGGWPDHTAVGVGGMLQTCGVASNSNAKIPIAEASGMTVASVAMAAADWDLGILLRDDLTGGVEAVTATFGGATLRTLAYGAGACNVSVRSRPDLVFGTVIINHRRIRPPVSNVNIGGWELVTDKAGSGVAGQPGVLVHDFDYTEPAAASAPTEVVEVVTRPVPDTGTTAQAALRNFWQHHAPSLAALVARGDAVWADFTFADHVVTGFDAVQGITADATLGTPSGGQVGGGSHHPNELVSGSVRSWFGSAAPARASCVVTGGGVDMPLAAEYTSTNASTRRYQQLSGGVNYTPMAQLIPAGMAATLQSSVNTLEWEGEVEQVPTAVHLRPGERLNVTGGRVDWAGMRALIYEVTYDEFGGSRARLGASRRLGLDRILALTKQFSKYTTSSFSFAQKKQGQEAVANAGGGTLTSDWQEGRPLKNDVGGGGGGSGGHPFKLAAATKNNVAGLTVQMGFLRADGLQHFPTLGQSGVTPLGAVTADNFQSVTLANSQTATIYFELTITEDDFAVMITTAKIKAVVGAVAPADTPTVRHLIIGTYAKSSTGTVTVASLLQWNLEVERCGPPAVAGASSWTALTFQPL